MWLFFNQKYIVRNFELFYFCSFHLKFVIIYRFFTLDLPIRTPWVRFSISKESHSEFRCLLRYPHLWVRFSKSKESHSEFWYLLRYPPPWVRLSISKESYSEFWCLLHLVCPKELNVNIGVSYNFSN